MTDRTYNIHPTAVVDEPSDIGAGTSIWHFSHVLKGSEIGKNCKVGQNVVIGPNAVVGNNVKTQNNVSVYEGVILEDNVFCGPSMVFGGTLWVESEGHDELKCPGSTFHLLIPARTETPDPKITMLFGKLDIPTEPLNAQKNSRTYNPAA